jgi:hypothetical protein
MSDNKISSNNLLKLNTKDKVISNNLKSKNIENIPLCDKKIDDNTLINLVKSLENLGFNHSK